MKSQTGHWVSLDILICYGVKFLESEIKTLFVLNFFIEKKKKSFKTILLIGYCLGKNLIFLYVLDYFDELILKIFLKNKKNIILMYFSTKNILKNNRNYTPKQSRLMKIFDNQLLFFTFLKQIKKNKK